MKTLIVNRNIIGSILAVMSLIYGLQGVSYAQDAPEPVVEFSDRTLAIAVRIAIGRQNKTPTPVSILKIREMPEAEVLKIPKAELAKLKSLSGGGSVTDDLPDITDLSGLEHATQLLTLYLRGEDVTDLTPLTELTQLTYIDLWGNRIFDIEPLRELTQLRELYLARNEISDISPLAGLTELRELYLDSNEISDISPLAGLTELRVLWLYNNRIRDISALTELTELTWLILITNQISDITPLAQLTNLTYLGLTNNQIRDVSPLSQLKILRRLRLRYNRITDASPLITLLDEIPDLDIDIEIVREAAGPTITASTAQPLTAATLNGSVVTLKLSSGAFESESSIGEAVTISGITGITFDETDIERVSEKEVEIQITFEGKIDSNTTLIFTVGPGAIRYYNGPSRTAEISVTAGTKAAVTEASTIDATVSISPAAVGSPAIGQQLEFSLNITKGEAVAGYQATVQFDTTALRHVESSNSDYLPDGAFFAQPVVEGNLVKLNAVSLAGESDGDGTLATLTFEVIAVKASTLTLSDVLLSNSGGKTFAPQVENAEITESTGLKGDVNGDGTVNIGDLVLVASNLGKTGQNAADVNGDGVVNIADLVLVAGALGTSAAAPSLHPQALEVLTAADVKLWLSQAQLMNLTDPKVQRGILFLEQLLVALTPKKTALLANYPNPFNPETWIPYHLAKDADVTLHIYAVNGTLVRTLALGHQPAGIYQNRSRAAYWDGKNAFGEPVASGVYFYTITAGDFTATRKMLIRK